MYYAKMGTACNLVCQSCYHSNYGIRQHLCKLRSIPASFRCNFVMELYVESLNFVAGIFQHIVRTSQLQLLGIDCCHFSIEFYGHNLICLAVIDRKFLKNTQFELRTSSVIIAVIKF